jgi:hypothetical protein
VDPRAGLNAVVKKKNVLLPGIEPPTVQLIYRPYTD